VNLFVLLLLKTLSGGRRRDEYLGTFDSEEAAREFLLSYGFVGAQGDWRNLFPGTGPFDSLCLYGRKPKQAKISNLSLHQAFAILQFES
jgi:hypothetical protein